jgi:ubiquinone/menaquinone biosynthesis C-methylase UbiE
MYVEVVAADVGCGTGQVVETLTEQDSPVTTVYAIDPSPSQLAAAYPHRMCSVIRSTSYLLPPTSYLLPPTSYLLIGIG